MLHALMLHATHNRAGSITYKHISGNTYEFTIKTCTKSSSEADRDELEIKWGDGTLDTIARVSIIASPLYDVQENVYVGTHDFTGPGSYIISVEDPNRNAGIVNISASVDQRFCVQSELIISPFIGTPNNSVIIEDCPCPEFACQNLTYCYNLSAFDPDGDSLAYSLVPCRGEDCLEMAIGTIYNYPDDIGGGAMSIDPISGTLCWVNPVFVGEYNLAIKISEYRNGIYIGAVLLDMQLTVDDCNNKPPLIEEKPDTCIFVGAATSIPFSANDTEDNISLFATGNVFSLPNNPGIFTPVTGLMNVTGFFNWTPTCDQALTTDYQIIIHAEDDNAEVKLSDLFTYNIKVKLPPVENVVVTPLGGSMQLNWDVYHPSLSCADFEYKIYRRIDSVYNYSECCDPMLPINMGFVEIGRSETNTYIDNDLLSVGNKYCYLVTIINDKGVESCISEVVCEKLKFEVPAITNVSVLVTDVVNGIDTIFWSWPKLLNQVNFPGPYYYELYRNNNFDINTNTLIYTTSTASAIELVDTFYVDLNRNTNDQAYTYQVKLYSNSSLVGTSSPASSVYLSSVPNDNQLTLNWTENVSWYNEYYKVYKEVPTGSGSFVFIDSTFDQTYTDTGLVNLQTYCYKILSIGYYSENGIRSPLENWSQTHCNIPFDYTAPCAPIVAIDGDCEKEETYLTWTNPNNSCSDDVVKYNIYFAPFSGDSLTFLTTINNDLDTFYIHKDRGSIAGCYYVTAVDSLPYNNESVPSNMVCMDNCDGYYALPNVFTPNGNSVNDLYHPLLPIKFVESIDLKVFNRYGDLVHQSNDPMINWDGTYMSSGTPLSDGVYFYVCKVNVVKLAGITPIELNGTITIFNSK
ncbi:hypothetical protein DNU06_12310 [Putridiphycobacter roseus]|uniref:Fibronectin type-III domain-containing protein n=2 Tax=Putridiphycobacter roseus TaxID=2219161 RepID=A0A2W1N144_9FLAO|nr:hypothetical protein DNU06_12310 [Putridiphycobacter roseus]